MEIEYNHDGDGDAQIEIEIRGIDANGEVIAYIDNVEYRLKIGRKHSIFIRDCKVIASGLITIEPEQL